MRDKPVEMPLETVEVPRHVHRPGRTSKIVWTRDELMTAVTVDGWDIDPQVRELPAPDPLGEDAPDDPPAEGEPLKRKPGRPKKA